LDIEGIDRMCLNLYPPMLQTGGGVATFFRDPRGAKGVSTTLLGPMTHAFVKDIEGFAEQEGIEIYDAPHNLDLKFHRSCGALAYKHILMRRV